MRFVGGTTALFIERLVFLAFVFFQAGVFDTGAEPANWPRWRGPNDNGSAEHGAYPVRWDSTNLLWKASLPGKGCSTPIVWNKRIFLTAPSHGLDTALAFDWNGKAVWQTTLGPEKAGRHPNGSGSNPSPATDGKAVFVYFYSGDLAALSLDGKVRWRTNLVAAFGPDTLFWDQGSSPVLTRDCVVMARMNHGESWLAAFDKATGRMRWKVPRNYQTAEEGDHAYTTPLVFERQGKEDLLVWGAEHLTSYDASDGKLLWSCGGFNPKGIANLPSVASPLIAGQVAVVSRGKTGGSRNQLYGIRLDGEGDVTTTARAWSRDGTGSFVPTPAEYKGRIYLLRDRGEVECIDPATGNSVWQGALPKESSSYYASPLVAGGMLYALREDGVVFVVRVEGKFEILAENHMDERIIASPVAIANRLLIRGERHLFCITAEKGGNGGGSQDTRTSGL
jgi:outer membrane protein assembly factor BamB